MNRRFKLKTGINTLKTWPLKSTWIWGGYFQTFTPVFTMNNWKDTWLMLHNENQRLTCHLLCITQYVLMIHNIHIAGGKWSLLLNSCNTSLFLTLVFNNNSNPHYCQSAARSFPALKHKCLALPADLAMVSPSLPYSKPFISFAHHCAWQRIFLFVFPRLMLRWVTVPRMNALGTAYSSSPLAC